VFEDTDLWVRMATLGPFAFLRCKTIVRVPTQLSLMETAGRSGAYLAAIERHGHKLAELLGRTPGRAAEAARAQGTALVAQALIAMDAGDDERVGPLLAEACDLQPELSNEPGLLTFRLSHHLPSVTDSRGYALACLRCAEAWPDSTTITAHWLRIHAALAGLRTRQPRLALQAIRGWRWKGTLTAMRLAGVIVPMHLARALEKRSASAFSD
jgi:hypothetical protein